MRLRIYYFYIRNRCTVYNFVPSWKFARNENFCWRNTSSESWAQQRASKWKIHNVSTDFFPWRIIKFSRRLKLTVHSIVLSVFLLNMEVWYSLDRRYFKKHEYVCPSTLHLSISALKRFSDLRRRWCISVFSVANNECLYLSVYKCDMWYTSAVENKMSRFSNMRIGTSL